MKSPKKLINITIIIVLLIIIFLTLFLIKRHQKKVMSGDFSLP